MNLFVELSAEEIAELDDRAAVHFFQALIWCAGRRADLPMSCITISAKTDVPDGGIDAEIGSHSVSTEQDILLRGNSFFQIKAGTTAAPWRLSWLRQELFGRGRVVSKASLGTYVKTCLSKRGRYVLVCFGIDLTAAQRRSAIKHLTGFFRQCGYRAPRVDVWGSSTIAAVSQPFPSLALRLKGRHDAAFSSHEEWALDAQMYTRLHLGDHQRDLIATLQGAVRGTAVGHVYVFGEPGIGKTRLVLEALRAADLAPAVIYIRHPEQFQRSSLFHTLLRSDNDSHVILVIDDCPEQDRMSLWNVLRQRSGRIHLVTIGHEPTSPVDDRLLVMQCPPLNKDEIKTTLAEYVTSEHETDRWAEFCSGFPRVAHAVGQNLRSNPEDLLRPPSTVPIWDRFVRGNSRIGDSTAAEHELVLHHIALFRRFGFEQPVKEEARRITSVDSVPLDGG